MNTVIQFRIDKNEIKTKLSSPISTPSNVGQISEEIKKTLTCKTQRFQMKNPSQTLIQDHAKETDLTSYR